MSETEIQQPPFSDLAAGLPDRCQADFYKTLHEAGVGPKDIELARLLRALQLYKAYYESIPAAIQNAVDEVGKIKAEIVAIEVSTRESVQSVKGLTSELIAEAKKFSEDLKGFPARLEAAMRKAADGLAAIMAESVNSSIKETVLTPIKSLLAGVSTSNQAFRDAIDQSNQAVTVLKTNVETIRRLRWRAIWWGGGAFVCLTILAAWFGFNRWYTNQLEVERAALVEEFDKNRTLLLELSKTHRTLELHKDPDDANHLFITLKDPSGAQSAQKHGVIEFQN